MKVELGDKDNVISIEVFRRNRQMRRIYEQCPHNGVTVDTSLTTLICRDCGASLNPVEWVASLAEEWDRIKRMTDDYKKATEKYEKLSKTKCRHCGKMTSLR